LLSYETECGATQGGKREEGGADRMKPSDVADEIRRLHVQSYGWALHCCERNEADAQDVLQSAYVRVLEGRARFSGRSAFRTWLFGVIRRTAQEFGRRERRHAAVPDGIGLDLQRGESAQDRLERTQHAERLLSSLSALPERQRDVLHLVFYQDMTIEQAADVLGIGLGTARTHYARGKTRLRQLLTEETR